MPLLALEQRSDEWFEARRGKLTASLAAACLGLDPHTGPLSAYNQITGLTKAPENRYMVWGRENEGKARTAYEVMSGNFVAETGLWAHVSLPWLAASPDGIVMGGGLVEIKCPSVLPTEIPLRHRIQMDVQLACTNRDWCDYYAWAGNDSFCCRLMRDHDRERELLFLLERFWEEHIRPGIAPPRRRPKHGAAGLVEPGAPAGTCDLPCDPVTEACDDR